MAKKKDSKPEKKGFLKLFKTPVFFSSKAKAKRHLERKKGEAKIMIEAVMEMQRKIQYSVSDNIAEYGGDEQEEIYLYDFLNEYGANGSFQGGDMMATAEPIAMQGQPRMVLGVSDKMEEVEPKLKLKPIDVWKELETIPVPVTLENLDEKILVLKMKKEFIKQNRYAKKEVIDMVTRLENRKQYAEFKDFFEQYDCTTTDKINALVNKYELVLKTSDLFIPKFPKEAMEIMKAYKDNVKKLCKKSPIFYVIAEKKMFKDEEKRNDPILLVQSPFGIYWQILGAWDKELVLMDEL